MVEYVKYLWLFVGVSEQLESHGAPVVCVGGRGWSGCSSVHENRRDSFIFLHEKKTERL